MYQNTKRIKKNRKITSLNGLLGKFALESFDLFFNEYKRKHSLAAEALLALEHFLTTLNGFFDLVDDINEEMFINNTSISWYSYTNAAASGDYIRAVSKYYNEVEFSNISINMSVEEADDYDSDKGVCYGKVFILSDITSRYSMYRSY